MTILQHNILHQINQKKTKTCIKRNFVHHLFEILLVDKLTSTFINERWQPCNITSYTKVTKKGTNSKIVQIKIFFCKLCVWLIVDEWTTIYTYHERWHTYKITSCTKVTKQGPIRNMFKKTYGFCKPYVWSTIDNSTNIYTSQWKMTNLQYTIMHQNSQKKANSKKVQRKI